MSDPNRGAPTELICGIGVALMEAGRHVLCADDHVLIVCPAGLAEFVKALDARYLLVPRGEIVGTEYGVRGVQGPDDSKVFDAEDCARAMQAEQERTPAAEPVERLVLAWQAIAAPEVGAEAGQS